MFQPHLETCPICGSTGNCHIHDYYGRSIIDFQAGKREKSDLCVMRVFCDSCEHAHAILPDVIIPYSSYSLLFILRLLGQYFAGRFTIEQLCERYEMASITPRPMQSTQKLPITHHLANGTSYWEK